MASKGFIRASKRKKYLPKILYETIVCHFSLLCVYTKHFLVKWNKNLNAKHILYRLNGRYLCTQSKYFGMFKSCCHLKSGGWDQCQSFFCTLQLPNWMIPFAKIKKKDCYHHIIFLRKLELLMGTINMRIKPR